MLDVSKVGEGEATRTRPIAHNEAVGAELRAGVDDSGLRIDGRIIMLASGSLESPRT